MSDTSNLLVLGLGFVLGLKHATDPDHIVTVTTFLGEERHLRRACAIGLFRGLGHTIALSIAGLIVIGLKIPMSKWLADRLELAAVLIILGARLISTVHTRWHEHHHDFAHRRLSLRPLFVGMVQWNRRKRRFDAACSFDDIFHDEWTSLHSHLRYLEHARHVDDQCPPGPAPPACG
jgi:ABC-type nickel/cobalt efflux system permease component RcnA